MPFRESEPGPPESLPPETAPGPSFLDVAGASLRDSNSVVSIYRGLANSGPLAPTPGYSAHDLLMSRPDLWPHRFRLAAAQSEGQANAIVADIDQQTADRTTLAAAGPMGYVVGAGMGLFDPTNIVPGRVAIRAWQETRGALRGAIDMGVATTIQGGAQQTALYATQPDASVKESLISVGSGTLLGIFLGAGAGWLHPGEGAAIAIKMDRERAAADAHVAGEPPPQQGFKVGDSVHVETGGVRQTKEPVKVTDIQEKDGVRYYQTDFEGSKAYVPESDLVAAGEPAAAREPVMGGTSVGATAGDERSMADLTMVGAYGAEKLPGNIITRMLRYASLTARRRATELSETAVLVEGNIPKQVIDTEMVLDAKGEPVLGTDGKPVVKVTPRVDAEGRPVMTVKTTTPGGMAPIQTVSNMEQNVTVANVMRALEEAWKDTNFGGAQNAPWFAKLRDEMSAIGLPSPARVTFEDFSKQVGEAAMFDKKVDNPHMQRVVDMIKPIFDKWSGRAERPGGVEGFKRAEQVEGENYFPHVWNKVMIQAKRPQFVNKLVEKFSGDQAANAATQRRLQAHQNSLESHEGNIKKYTKQLERLQDDLALDEAKAEEVRRQNKFGYQYSESLREGQYKNVGGIREDAPDLNIEKGRAADVFATETRRRGNTLADQAAVHRAKVADLEEKLQAEHASAAAVRARIEEEIGKWHGTSKAEAMAAIKAREKYEAEREAKRAAKGGEEPKGGRLRSADEAVDRAVQHILNSDQNLTLQELRDQAHETVQRILGSPDGRLPYEKADGLPQFSGQPKDELRGSLHERPLDVSNEWAKDWIEHDPVKAIKHYMRTFVPDVLLAERYGDSEMTNEFRRLENDYARLIDAAGPNEKEVARLGKERLDAIEDLAILRDRIRGIYALATNASERRIGRVAAALRNYSTVSSMGLAAIASIPDTAGVIFRWGMGSTFNDAWAPFIKSMATDKKYAREAIRQFQVMDIGNETLTAMRHHELNGITDPYAGASKFETTLQYGADKMQLLNLMGPQTDILKVLAATVASTGIYRAAKRAAAGKATKTDLLQLGQANISPHLYEHIVEQYEKSGTEIDGHMLPNTEAWKHPEARAAFEAAVHRDVNLSVVTPGIDQPGFISQPVVGVFTQFKSFTLAATTRILVANLQRSDAHSLQGVVASLGFGAMAYYVHALATGQPVSNNPQDVLKEAISRGNLTGWLDEANTLMSKATRGQLDIYRGIGAHNQLSRGAGQSAVENLLGPTVGKMSNLTRVTGAMATGDVNAGDIHAVRRAMGYNNLWFLNRALTAVENGIGSSFGIKQPQPRAQ